MSDTDENNILFGRVLNAILERKGWTKRRLAQELGYDPAMITKWCKGIHSVSLSQALKICEVMHLSGDEKMELLAYKSEAVPGRLARIQEILRRYKDHEALDYIGYVEKGQVVCSIATDFADRMAAITEDDPHTQKNQYTSAAREILALVAEIDTFIKPLDQGQVRHIMIDPPFGGIFFHRLEDPTRGYLFAATADQEYMDNGEADKLVREIGKVLDSFMRGERR